MDCLSILPTELNLLIGSFLSIKNISKLAGSFLLIK